MVESAVKYVKVGHYHQAVVVVVPAVKVTLDSAVYAGNYCAGLLSESSLFHFPLLWAPFF